MQVYAFRLALVLVIATRAPVLAADTGAEEYQVKAAYLLNFAKFVEWPDQTFKAPGDPIGICILGENPFGPLLAQAAKNVVIGSRPISVLRLTTVSKLSQCQIAFVSASERKLSRNLLEAAQSGAVLTVGESDGFTDSGGIVAFKLDGEKVRLMINTAAADHAKLHVSAKLLSLAGSAKRQTQ